MICDQQTFHVFIFVFLFDATLLDLFNHNHWDTFWRLNFTLIVILSHFFKCALNTTLQGKQLTDLNLGCIFLHWVWISPVVKNTPWQRLCAWNVNQPKLNPPQTHHVCSGHFSFSELWQTQQTSTTAELGVPAEDTDKLPFLPYPRPRLFVFPFF